MSFGLPDPRRDEDAATNILTPTEDRRDCAAATTESGAAVVVFGQEANRPGDATNAPGHDTEEVTSMPDKLTRLSVAQQRVLDYLLADKSGDFIIVPHSVCSVTSPFEKLLALGLIEQEVRSVPIPPGSFDAFYRAVR